MPGAVLGQMNGEDQRAWVDVAAISVNGNVISVAGKGNWSVIDSGGVMEGSVLEL